GKQAVYFAFDIRSLGIYRGGQAFGNQRREVVDQPGVFFYQFFRRRVRSVSPIPHFRIPKMTLKGQSKTAKFAQYDYPSRIFFRGSHSGTGVLMHVDHMAAFPVGPSAHAVDQTGRIVLLRPFYNSPGVVLPPSFIKNNPRNNAWEEFEMVDHGFEFSLELGRRFGGAIPIDWRVGA